MSEEKKRGRKRKVTLEESSPSLESVIEQATEALEDDGSEEGFTVKRPPWLLRVEGLNLDIPLTGIKLPTFTSGMIDRGDITIETINVPEIALNSYFRNWLMKPLPRRLHLKILDAAGRDIEGWHMTAVPGAMGFSELDVQDDAPWVTQVAFSITEIRIEPTKAA